MVSIVDNQVSIPGPIADIIFSASEPAIIVLDVTTVIAQDVDQADSQDTGEATAMPQSLQQLHGYSEQDHTHVQQRCAGEGAVMLPALCMQVGAVSATQC